MIEIINKINRGFEVIEPQRRRDGESNPQKPRRGTKCSAGYDFYAPKSYVCEPHKVTKIWTGIGAYMNDDEVLLLDVRSSQGGKFHLANTLGIIDSRL